MKKILKNHEYHIPFYILLLIIFTTEAYGQKTTGNLNVNVQIKDNAVVNIQRTNDIVVENLPTQQAKVIQKADPNCCFCTQKYKDGTYIDEFKNSYLIDRNTNRPAINNLNRETKYVIFCPQISIKK
jgi:hypothetical protein